MSEAQRDAVWQELPARLSTLSARVRLLPWTRGELVNWVRDTIAARLGTWAVGVSGALAEFPCRPPEAINLDVEESGSVVARAPEASFRLRINEKVRAFAFNSGPIVLGLPKGRAVVPSFSVLQSLGPDVDAIDDAHRGERLFDLGLGNPNVRFCIRTGDDALLSALSEHAGRRWPNVTADVEKQLISANPNGVIESAVARIEFSGPRSRTFPDGSMAGGAIAADLALPDYAAPVAIFYPKAIRN